MINRKSLSLFVIHALYKIINTNSIRKIQLLFAKEKQNQVSIIFEYPLVYWFTYTKAVVIIESKCENWWENRNLHCCKIRKIKNQWLDCTNFSACSIKRYVLISDTLIRFCISSFDACACEQFGHKSIYLFSSRDKWEI